MKLKQSRRFYMGIKANLLHQKCISVCEKYFMDRVFDLVAEDRIDDSDAIYLEFVLDGTEPEDWMFINDLTNV
jgi:hypothetical protein